MEQNIKIAKQLIGLAKELVGRATFTDGLGEDSDNSNDKYDKQYFDIIKKLYPQNMVDTIQMSDENCRRFFPIRGTMGNGNLVLKYYADRRRKQLIIMALVAEKHRLVPSDVKDLMNLYKFLKKQVEDGYVILTDCNTYSITFLATFAKKNGYYFHADRSRDPFMGRGVNDEKNMSRQCVCCKNPPPYAEENNVDEFTKDRNNLDKLVD